MPRSPTDASQALNEFLRVFLEDLKTGRVRALDAYRALFPDHGPEIEQEYMRLRGAEPQAPVPGPGPDTVLDVVRRRTGAAPEVRLAVEAGEDRLPPLAPLGGQAIPRGRANYQLLGEIARGGMGTVIRAHDADLGRDVALKVLNRELERDAAVVQRFVEEAQIGGQLQHPGVVPVYELGLLADERPFFAMKLVKGRSLASLLRERDPPGAELRRFLSIFEQACQAMAYAHSRGVIHRDLKPANVMVGAFGEVQLVDWGLAKVLRGGGVDDERRAAKEAVSVITTVRSEPGSDGSKSRHGSVMGTPAYMSPEQAQGRIASVDERSDVFALGAILCEILTGQAPYVGRDLLDQAAAARLAPAMERMAACGADDGLVAIAKRALEVEPAARYKSAEQLARELSSYSILVDERARRAQVEAAEARVEAKAERRARMLILALGATIVVSLAAGGLGYLGYEGRERARREGLARSIRDAIQDAAFLRGKSELEDARHSVRRAELLAAQGAIDAQLGQEIATLRGALDAEIARAVAAAELARRNEQLLVSLAQASLFEHYDPVELSEHENKELPAGGGMRTSQWAQRTAAYEEAFAAYGLDVDAAGDDAVVAAFASSEIAAAVAVFLDDWARVVRESGHDAKPARLVAIARRLDPDPWRNRLRDAVVRTDENALLALASDADMQAAPPLSRFLLGQTLRGLGRLEVATEVLQQCVHQHPEDFMSRLELASCLLEATPRREVEALRYLEGAIGLQPTSVLALVKAGRCLRLVQEHELSVRYLEKARELNPREAWVGQQLALSLQAAEDPAGALVAIDATIERDPRSALGWTTRAALLLSSSAPTTGELEQALEAATTAITLEASHDPAHLALGQARWSLGRRAESIAAYEEAVRLAPGNKGYLDVLGHALVQMQRFEEAIHAFEAIPDRAFVARHLVDVYLTMDDLVRADAASCEVRAEAASRELLLLEPIMATYEQHGLILARANRLDEARVVYGLVESWHRLRKWSKPEDRDVHYQFAYFLEMQCVFFPEKAPECMSAYTEVMRLDPEDAGAHNNLAWQLVRFPAAEHFDPERAVELALTAVERKPGEAAMRNTLGMTQYWVGRYAECIATLEKSVELVPPAGVTTDWYFMAMAWERLGNHERALECFERGRTVTAETISKADVNRFAEIAREVLGLAE